MSVIGVLGQSADATLRSLQLMLRATVSAQQTHFVTADGRLRIVRVVSSAARGSEGWALFHDPETDVAVVGEARIDNEAELADELGASCPSSDSAASALGALLLGSYLRWGVACAGRWLGDYALCIWDGRVRALHLVRDTTGTKSLFYLQGADGLAWSSNVLALRTLPQASVELDERMVVDYLGEFPQDESRTFFRDCKRIPPGSLLTSRAGEAPRVHQYYDLEAVRPTHWTSDDEAAAALRDTLDRAVACRLRGQSQCGAMLSGGLDSSFVTALAARTLRERNDSPLLTLSAIFDDDSGCDERRYQGLLRDALGTRHAEYRPEPDGSSGDFERLSRVFGQPASIGPHWLAWPAAELAAARGVGLVLTGIDGDRVVSHGVGRLPELARAAEIGKLFQECITAPQRTPLGRLRLFATQLALPLVPSAWIESLDARRALASDEAATAFSFIHPELVERTGVKERLACQAQRSRSTREAHLRALTAPDRTADLELLAALGAEFGVEFAHPFFDRRVVELCLSFPGDQRRRRGQSRFALRNAMAGVVPDPIRERQNKAHFDRPFRAWALTWLKQKSIGKTDCYGNLSAYLPGRTVEDQLALALAGRATGPALDFLWRSVILSRWINWIAEGRSPDS